MEETAKFEKELVAFLPLLPHVGECGAAFDTYNVVVMRDAWPCVWSWGSSCRNHVLVIWSCGSFELVTCIEQMCSDCATDWTSLLHINDERCHLVGVWRTLPAFSVLGIGIEKGKKRGLLRDRGRSLDVLLPFEHCVVMNMHWVYTVLGSSLFCRQSTASL